MPHLRQMAFGCSRPALDLAPSSQPIPEHHRQRRQRDRIFPNRSNPLGRGILTRSAGVQVRISALER